MKNKTKKLTRSAVIAGMYIILTYVSYSFGLANGAIQLRLSETLTLLPVIIPESIWGLYIGCTISNLLTGCVVWDILFGGFATLLGAFLTYKLRKNRFIASLAPVLSNGLIVPFVLKYAYGLGDAWWYLCFTVCIGEIAACCILAPLVVKALEKHKLK